MPGPILVGRQRAGELADSAGMDQDCPRLGVFTRPVKILAKSMAEQATPKADRAK